MSKLLSTLITILWDLLLICDFGRIFRFVICLAALTLLIHLFFFQRIYLGWEYFATSWFTMQCFDNL